jgi:hypothetical protein
MANSSSIDTTMRVAAVSPGLSFAASKNSLRECRAFLAHRRGAGPMVRDPLSGKCRRTRLFVLTLGYSRKSIRPPTLRSSTRIWVELHERAFRRLGGVTRVVALDNLGEGVLAPDIYDPALNPLYRNMLTHYGAVALPCRVGDPDRKDHASHRTPLAGSRVVDFAAR